jgi:hypothetical protein
MNFDWVVGFYEGEGNPGRLSSKYEGRCYSYLRLQIAQKEKSILLKIKKFFKNQGYVHVFIYPDHACWRLYVTANDAIKLAKKMLPRMQSTAKRKQLEDALKGRFHKTNLIR